MMYKRRKSQWGLGTFPTAASAGLQSLGLQLVRRLPAQLKTGMELGRNPGTLED
jgi:two-component sensor histidine kinase